jgi:hypothetical protein
MIRVNWFSVAKKINTHFKTNVFIPKLGPDFRTWLLEETGGKLVADLNDMNTLIEFANDEDYTMFMLKWGS